ncbi:unnamed protein product, partial [marine sediment metagenome]
VEVQGKYLNSRTYSRREREFPWFKKIQDKILVGDPFRPWETPAVLAACGIDPKKRYLSVGAWHCSATYIIGQVAEIHALDVNGSVTDWLENEFKLHWPKKVKVVVVKEKGVLPYPDRSFDVVISVSSIEHGIEEEDINTAKECGRVLKRRGRFVLTTEFGPKFVDYDPVVGGRIYDEKALEERIVKPSGCRWVGEHKFVHPDYGDIKRVELLQMVNPLCPVILVLEK